MELFKIEDIQSYDIDVDLMKASGFEIVSNGFSADMIQEKIHVHVEKEYPSYRLCDSPAKSIKGVSLSFSHVANGYRKTRRYIKARNNSFDLDVFRAKVIELLALHEEFDRHYAELKQAEHDATERRQAMRKRCAELGLDDLGDRFEVKVSADGVDLNVSGISPELAVKIVAMVKVDG